jgi:transposase InsO family protein
VNLFHSLSKESRYLNGYQLITESNYSRSQFYRWLKAGSDGIAERKSRECKPVSSEVVKNALSVIRQYPHFSASKGQCYMLYHQLGYIPHHLYKSLKKIVKRVLFREVWSRRLLPARTCYTHERSENPGEIWAQDFTQLRVCGKKYYVALVIDVAMTYYLGATASLRADSEMVEAPVIQALEFSGGQGPGRFLLSDNGAQYVSTRHGDFLDKLDIVQKRIPSCKPEYNGSIECGIKEFKNVFYNVWAELEERDVAQWVVLEEEEFLVVVQWAVKETIRRLNEEIPRPSLNGVTPADVLKGKAAERIEINRKYMELQRNKKEVTEPWNRNDWGLVKKHLFKGHIGNRELMTKFCFFLKRPLRKLEHLGWELLGN